MLDPASAEVRDVTVDWMDPRHAVGVLSRPRPFAYLVLPSHTEVVRRLSYAGVEMHRLVRPTDLEVESYDVTERRADSVFVEGHLRSAVSTEVTPRRRHFPAGTFVFPLAQANANILVAALEPESPSSFVSLGLVPVDRRGVANPQRGAPSEVPIFRLRAPADLPMMRFPDSR